MTTPVLTQLQPFKTPLGCVPEQGPTAYPLTIAWDNDSVFTKEFQQEQATLKADFFQSVYIDNSNGGAAVTLTISETGQNITVKAATQGTYPLIAQAGNFTLTITGTQAAGKKTALTLLNFMVPYINWLTA